MLTLKGLFGLRQIVEESQQEPEAITKQIRNYFESGKPLTVSTCYNLFKTHDLRKYVSRLRSSGLNIADQWETDSFGRNYKKYFLLKEVKNV